MISSQISYLKTLFLPPLNGSPEGNKEEEKKSPLVIVLHGLGDSIEGYRFLPQFLGIPDIAYLLVNAPDTYVTGYSWFDLDWGEGPEPGIMRSRGLLFQLLGDLNKMGWDRLALFGFSQGALLTLDVATRYSLPLNAIIAISGYAHSLEKFPQELAPAATAQKIFASHGRQDPLLPIQRTRQQIEVLQGMGLNIVWKEYDKDHTIEPVEEAGDIGLFLRANLLA